MKRILSPMLLCVVLLFSMAMLQPVSTLQAQSETAYECPMHPKIISDKPGSCPKCGMDLVKKKSGKVKQGDVKEKGPAVPKSKPIHRKVVKGFDITCWLFTKDECREKCGMEMRVEKKEEEAEKTHCVLVTVTDSKTKKPVEDAVVWFHIIYPSKRNLMPKLKGHGEIFSGAIALAEKGKYTLMVHVTAGDEHPATTFKYSVK